MPAQINFAKYSKTIRSLILVKMITLSGSSGFSDLIQNLEPVIGDASLKSQGVDSSLLALDLQNVFKELELLGIVGRTSEGEVLRVLKVNELIEFFGADLVVSPRTTDCWD